MSKLSFNYKMDYTKKLNFYHPEQSDIDPIFYARLAAADITEIVSGYRTNELQAQLVKEAVQNNKGYYEYQGGAYNQYCQCMVAPPGTSWHNFKVAVDVASEWAKSLTNEYLAPFGLFKPMDYEPWHIQPIETATDYDKQSFLDACNEIKEVAKMEITTLEQALNKLNEKAEINIEYWKNCSNYVKYLEELLIKIAKVV